MIVEKLFDMARGLFSPEHAARERRTAERFWGQTELPPLLGLFDPADEPAYDINDHVEAHLRRAYEMAMAMERSDGA